MTIDYTQLSGPDLIHECGQNAAKWAAAFQQIVVDAGRTVDEEVMMGWFANAIMHTLDMERGTIINGEHAEYLLSREA